MENLERAFRQTLSSDAEQRALGEGYLLQRRESATPFWTQILELLSNQHVELEVRMAAAAYLKNDVRKFWDTAPSSDTNQIASERAADVTFLKENLLEALVRMQDIRIQKIVGVCARTLCFNLFPENWNIVDQLEQALAVTNNQLVTSSALLILEKLVKRYRFVEHKEAARRPLIMLEGRLFPNLLLLADQTLQVASQQGHVHQIDGFRYLKLILKIYFSATFSTLDSDAFIIRTFEPWMTLLAKVIELGIPEYLVEAGADVTLTPMSRCEKRALQVVYRFFTPHASLEDASRTAWEQTYAPFFARAVIHCIKRQTTAPYNMHLCYRYLSLCFGKAITYQTIAPEFESLAISAFSLVHYSDDDEIKWQEDPADFFRSTELNFCEIIYTPRYAAKEFFTSAAKFRGNEYLGPILGLCKSRLESGDPRQADGALRILGELKQRLINRDPKESDKAKEGGGISVADLLTNYAFPLLQSPHAFLRLRAAWMYLCFAETIKGGSMAEPCERLLRLTNDPELPVKAQACVTIKAFLSRDDCIPIIEKHVVPLVRVLMSVMVECTSDEIMETVQNIAVQYKNQLLPMAGELCKTLSVHLQSWMVHDDDESLNKAVMACMHTLETVVTICADDGPEKLSYAFSSMADLLDVLVTRRHEDYLEDAVDIIAILAAKMPPPFPEELWLLFSKLMECVSGKNVAAWVQNPTAKFGVDYLVLSVPSFTNFILRDPSFWTRSLQGHSYITLFRTAIERVVSSDADCPIMYIFCAMLRSCPEVHAQEFFTWTTDFLWAMVKDRRRVEEAVFALCVVITMKTAFVLERIPIPHLLQAMQLAEDFFQGKIKRAARVHALTCLARVQTPEIQAARSWIWDTLRQDLESILQTRGEIDDEFDGLSDCSHDLMHNESAQQVSILDEVAQFEAFEDELKERDESELAHILPVVLVDDALKEAANLMRENGEACSMKQWDVVKEMLERRLLGGC